jgi:DNA mismatch repair protein MutL
MTPAPAPALAAAPGAGGVTGTAGFFGSLTYIGQLHRTYLVCEAGSGGERELVLVDQHAAHERIAFERLRAAHGRREIRRQRLLFPVPIEVDDLAALAETDASPLAALGFEVERSGAATILLRAVPELVKDSDPKPLLRDVLGQLADGSGVQSSAERLDHVLATMACHSVVRAGDVLGPAQAQALLAQLDAVDLRSHCPHGRPVLLRVPLPEIERRFGRT